MAERSGKVIGKVVAPNRLKEARLAAGIPTQREVAARLVVEPVVYTVLEKGLAFPSTRELAGLARILGAPVERLYPDNHAEVIARAERDHAGERDDAGERDVSTFFGLLKGPEHLLVRREEMNWSERKPAPGRPVDVYLSLSCGTQQNPNLLQDTVAVCEALGVSFGAAAGPAGCCGGPVWSKGVGPQWAHAKAYNLAELGVSTNVNWCTNCQIRLTGEADRREREEGVSHPIREVQVLSFLEERVHELGDRVPWKQEVHRKVAAEGHWAWTDVHRTAQVATTKLLSMIPGVEVVGLYDGHRPESPCAYRARGMVEGRDPIPDHLPEPRTAAEVRARRELLADTLNAMGADTISCQHQGCHLLWCYYASERLSVVHGVSVLAEALGVKHPDRFQAAARLGDPEKVLEQTRPIWESWAIPEADARELAGELADPRFSEGVTRCACGKDRCDEQLIAVDVLTARTQPLPATASAGA